MSGPADRLRESWRTSGIGAPPKDVQGLVDKLHH